MSWGEILKITQKESTNKNTPAREYLDQHLFVFDIRF